MRTTYFPVIFFDFLPRVLLFDDDAGVGAGTGFVAGGSSGALGVVALPVEVVGSLKDMFWVN